MDAHTVSFTSAAERSTSRIWKDLSAYHHVVAIDLLEKEDMSATLSVTANVIGKRRAQILGRLPRVGIVGAGFAGLRCADILLQHGFDVTVIEGRNRLGGRVHQVPLRPGHLVDAGPNWIHGTNNNPIMEIARKTDTATGTWESETSVMDDAGKMLPIPVAETHSSMLWEIIGDAFTHSNKNGATIDANESLFDFFGKQLAKRIPENSPDFEQKRNIMFQFAEVWGAYVGSHIVNQSLRFFWLEECIDGENLFCSGTYEKILAEIAKPAVEGVKFKYKTIVNKVRSSDDETCDTLKVYTEVGETLEFDEVVFTAPLGWLKQHPDAFDPPLPARLSKAIKNIGYGCLEKVIINFPKAFWLSAKPETDARGFILLLGPSYAPDSNPHRWNQEIVELASFAPPNSHPTLLFYTYGDQSRFLTNEVAKLASKEKKDAFLYEWFRPYYSRLPHYEEGSPDCEPVSCFATDWLKDDLAGNGSYSNFQVGLEEGDKDIEIMREGMPDRGLWLAGEHTAPFVALGTVTGAYWSGESVGQRIAQAYGREKRGMDGIN
ncbi:FAD/NAD(P)-binding domain-containing protein [Nemania sp. FL0916]|nr:FAD/NAD(P)-binding domain-containing protein [Nemania sp. FL0916]